MFVLLKQIQEKMRFLALKLIWLYQRFISPMLCNHCRYYPSCSEYAKWTLKNNSFLISCLLISFRILRCNPFFAGGIDYPIRYKKIIPNYSKPCEVLFWFIPLSGVRGQTFPLLQNKFLIIKSLRKFHER